MKRFLVKITLKHNLGLFILHFETMNPGLHYVPEQSILIEPGYLDWKGFSLRDFCNQRGCCFFSSAKILDKSFTCSEWIFKCIIGQSKNKKGKKKEKMTLGWKPERRSRAKTRKFLKSHGQSKQKNERAMTGQHPKPLWGPLPFPKPKIWTLFSRMPFPEFSSLSR